MVVRVLVVDDSEVNRATLGALLRGAGYEVEHAVDGRSAIAAATTLLPDLVLLDVLLPDMDGYEVCAALKAAPETADLPVIFVTSLTRASDRVRGLELGAVDYVSKPFDRAEVLARVASHLRLRAEARRLADSNVHLQRRQRLLERDLRAAADMQRALLPRAELGLTGASIGWVWEPCALVSGDLLLSVPLDDDTLALAVLDVSGHGVPSGMLSVAVAHALSPLAGLVRGPDGRPTPPGAVLDALQRELPLGRFDRYVTLVWLLLDLPTGQVRYSAAAHPPPLVVRAGGGIEALDAGGFLLGLGLPGGFPEGTTHLGPGDRLALYTDGVTETADAEGRMFGEAGLRAFLDAHRSVPADEAARRLARALAAWRGQEAAADDLSVLLLDRPAGGP